MSEDAVIVQHPGHGFVVVDDLVAVSVISPEASEHSEPLYEAEAVQVFEGETVASEVGADDRGVAIGIPGIPGRTGPSALYWNDSFTLTQQNLDDGYVDLTYEPELRSVLMFYSGLFQADCYSYTGKRITFDPSLTAAMKVGRKLHFNYTIKTGVTP